MGNLECFTLSTSSDELSGWIELIWLDKVEHMEYPNERGIFHYDMLDKKEIDKNLEILDKKCPEGFYVLVDYSKKEAVPILARVKIKNEFVKVTGQEIYKHVKFRKS